MKTIRRFDPLGDRYQFDASLCKRGAGWAQVDTTQDASYFGTWTNPTARQVLSFAEGDITLESAESDEEYWKGIDPGFDENLRAAFHRLGLEDLLH